MLTYASYKSNLCFLGENAPMRWIRRERKWFIGSVEIYPLGINEHHFFFFFHSFSVEFHSNPLLNRIDPLQILYLRRYFLREQSILDAIFAIENRLRTRQRRFSTSSTCGWAIRFPSPRRFLRVLHPRGPATCYVTLVGRGPKGASLEGRQRRGCR